MNLIDLAADGIRPALSLLPEKMNTPEAWAMMLAIGFQESRFKFRRQMNMGPAMGFWQFERGGGVIGVLRHASSKDHAARICGVRGVKPVAADVWKALEHDDVLAAAFARLLLWTDAKPLPGMGQMAAAWDYYMRTWRPGKPHPSAWQPCYERGFSFLMAATI